MKEIKFRAWYRHEKKMEYQDNKTPRWIGDILTDDYYLVMQYTGLKDKNGKEIYEGDIVNVWESEDLEYNAYEGLPNSIDRYSNEVVIYETYGFFAGDYGLGEVDVEVIGNIYENPELLKKEIVNENSNNTTINE